MKTNKTRKTKAIYSELVIARGSAATVTCILSETQRQAEELESFMVKKREAEGVASLEAVGLGTL